MPQVIHHPQKGILGVNLAIRVQVVLKINKAIYGLLVMQHLKATDCCADVHVGC